MPPDPERIRVALRYHARTEHHHPSRFARSLGYLDWETQPDPFLLHVGARSILLDEVSVGSGHERSWDAVLAGASERAPAPVDRASVGQLFFDSLALSAWKRSGQARWALRVNPSSGNLHPTEGYLFAGPIAGLTSGPHLLHYAPREHALEIRRRLSPEAWAPLAAQLPEGTLLLGLTTIAWREAWKYGERAFRYCQHDVGHAIGAVAVAAATLGWSARMIEGVPEHALARLLCVDDERGPEVERPDVLLGVVPRAHVGQGAVRLTLGEAALAALTSTQAEGLPTPLSSDHHPWPAIDEVADATEETGELASAEQTALGPPRVGAGDAARAPAPVSGRTDLATRAIVRRRRSAVAMDAATGISREAFFRFAARLLPHHAPGVLGALPWAPRVHPVFFVHRVEGVEPGLLVLVRDPAREAGVLRALEGARPEPLEGAAEGVRLFRIAEGDVRDVARACMCGQDIASDGAFAVAMMGELDATLAERGAAWWRRLHWEAGLLGQLLYLEAEAAGVRATGIGCFFDDAVSEVLGAPREALRCLYGFTIGGALDDARIETLDAYADRATATAALDLEPPTGVGSGA